MAKGASNLRNVPSSRKLMITLQKFVILCAISMTGRNKSFRVFLHGWFNSICATSSIFSSTFLPMFPFHSGLVSFLCYRAYLFLQITAAFLVLAVDILHLSFNIQRNNYRSLGS